MYRITNLALITTLLLLVGCGSDTRKVCKEEYEYVYNGYTYVEHIKMVCEDVED